jgi:hypothetical protein
MKAYFDQFQRALSSVIENDWDDFFVLFAPDAAVKLSFVGLDEDRVATPPRAFADFRATLRRFKHRMAYLGGSDRDCVFSYSAYARTRSGDSTLYGGHGYLEFNDEGDIVRLHLYSDDSGALSTIIHAQLLLSGPAAEPYEEADADEISF